MASQSKCVQKEALGILKDFTQGNGVYTNKPQDSV